jgi:hypothetical protein
MATPREEQLRSIVDAVARSVDTSRLARELEAPLAALSPSTSAAPAHSPGPARPTDDLLGRLVLADILDDTILGSRAGDKAYPLRLLLTSVSEALGTDTGLAFASALNVYFRTTMDEEVKMRLGIEASRLYYAFAAERTLEPGLVSQASPLLASLLGGELERVRFETVDNARVFDSQLHERTTDSDPASAHIRGPASFLCRVSATSMLRVRALVRT